MTLTGTSYVPERFAPASQHRGVGAVRMLVKGNGDIQFRAGFQQNDEGTVRTDGN